MTPLATYVDQVKTDDPANGNKGKLSEKIPNIAAASPKITIAELSEIIGVTTRSIERNIKKLRQQGRLSRIGPDKGGYWKIEKHQK